MTPGNDTRVAEARQRLAECPADPQLVTMPQHQLARLAVRLHGAAQLLDAHLRGRETVPADPHGAGSEQALTLDRGQAATVIAALEDAAALRREAASYCPDCSREPGRLCDEHAGSLDAAEEYDALRWRLEPALAPAPPASAEPAARPGGDQPARPGHQEVQDETPPARPVQCPECGEPAARREPRDPVPWEAHGMARPPWSHADGSALCPVPGPSGGYQPAQPIPAVSEREAEPGPDVARLDPPPSMRHHWPEPGATREAEAG